jgi:uncharacterized cupin superfamily protein
MPHEIARVDDDLAPLEVAAENLLGGDPQPRVKVLLHVAGDYSKGMSGIFEADPGATRNPQEGPETFHILEGRAKISDPTTGERFEVQAGDVLILSAGEWEWTYETRFRSLFAMGPTSEDHAAPAEPA